MSWIWLLVVLAVGWGLGYFTKDQLTEEYVSNVTMNRPKVKGKHNKMELDQVTEVQMVKKSWRQKRKARKDKKKKAKSSLLPM
ncbi:hypothetical protein LCGC14_1650840 [marine sediment metagenome]|uniref:Uncharacterized protein n=1 Tax=marine sediment metagenome TaxID=412755 RepID=A0A0F9IJB7_9ZZZZ